LGVESNLNDVLTVVLVFGLASLLHSEEFSAAGIAGEFLLTVFSSVAIGMASAYVWSHILKRVRDVQHHIFMTPAFLLLVFGVAEFLSGNGFLAAFAFAITLGNLEHIRIRLPHMFGGIHNFSFTQEERKFYEASSFLFKTFFFVYIGISLNIQNTTFLIWGALFMALLFALRVLIVKAVLGSSLSPRERLFVSGIFPKGVAGIAILAILGDQLLQDLSYPVILFSILYTSAFVFFAHYIAPFKEDAVPEPELQREQPQ
jgi:NhaP-type Na+/H+ or K+/H+ antiporter